LPASVAIYRYPKKRRRKNPKRKEKKRKEKKKFDMATKHVIVVMLLLNMALPYDT